MPHHMIQTDMYAEFGFRRLVDAMKTLNLEYSLFKLRPFDHVIEVIDGIFPGGAKPTMVWGMTTVEKCAKMYGWVPGVFKNENFNMRVLHEHYGDDMLNSDGKFYKLGDLSFDGTAFVRPVLDTKSFTGQLIDGEEFARWREALVGLMDEYTTVDLSTEVMIASPKKLIDEARFFIVGGQVVAGSLYRVDGRLMYKSIDSNTPLYLPMKEYAQYVTNDWQPAEAFVMDVGLTDVSGLKVIEVNCINSAGFYDSDMTAVVKAIENLQPWPDSWHGTPWFEERTAKAVAEWKERTGG